MTCTEPWILATAFATATCLFIFLYAQLKIRHARICQNLKSASESFAKQTKELEELKKSKNDLIDDFSPETTRSIIVAFNQEGVITYLNDYAEEFFGFSKEELLGKHVIGTIAPEPKRKAPNQPTLIEKILLNPQLYVDVETRNVRKNGEQAWISWTNRVVYDENNKPV